MWNTNSWWCSLTDQVGMAYKVRIKFKGLRLGFKSDWLCLCLNLQQAKAVKCGPTKTSPGWNSG